MRRQLAALGSRVVNAACTLVRRLGAVPAGAPSRRMPGDPGSRGGAGVREPRRPTPRPPRLSATEPEPERLQLLDLAER